MDTSTLDAPKFPALTRRLFVTAVLAGIAAVVAWEIWARLITPLWVGGPLEPAALVQSVFGFENRPLAEFIHVLTGIVVYPLGYVLIAQPFARLVQPGLSWSILSLAYGVVLWVFALFVMAYLFAGQPPFLGFIPLTWASLVGHLLFALVLGFVVDRREVGAVAG